MAITGKNHIGFSLLAESSSTFKAVNPVNQETLKGNFHPATEGEVDAAVAKAIEAFSLYKLISKEQKANFLERIAEEILALGTELVERTAHEAGLPEVRITGERGRTLGQLQMFASLVREGSWVEATIDAAIPDRIPVPKPDLRKMLVPIGPVVVFGASNFPLAFSTAGGDVASALAGGNPVIVKAHSSHPGTSELIAGAITKAAKGTGMPDGVFSHLQDHGFDTGKLLVNHPLVKAVGFTGSFNGGKALYNLAQNREEPIPVFAEMGSVNPVIVFPGALAIGADGIAQAYASSITLGAGQFCTNPGIIAGVASEQLEGFMNTLGHAIATVEPSTMLNGGIFENYVTNRHDALKQEGVQAISQDALEDLREKNAGKPVVARVKDTVFLANPGLHEEIFGPYSLVVECKNEETLRKVVNNLKGQLTVTVMATEEDLDQNEELIMALREKAGRIILNGVPTGVEVCHAMHHGGPYPATTDARFTSVGTTAIKRFVRPLCYQDWPEAKMPPELQDKNPYKIWRLVDGNISKDSLT